MRKNWNNKGRITLCLLFLTLSSMLLALCLILPEKANSGTYLDSAHGNTSYGVDRSGLASFGYSQGNCAHCHEQHASIGGTEPAPIGGAQAYELFRTLFVDQSSMFCFDCHKATGSSLQASMPSQYSYSYVRGGATTLTCPSDIMTAFQYEDTTGNSNPVNPCPAVPTFGSSAHYLSAIQNYLVSKWGFSATQADINPCSGCHDPHKAQRNFPVSQVSSHGTAVWELWGDDDNTTERLTVAVKVPPATGGYMSPYKVGSGYEEDTFPAGTNRTTNFKNRNLCRDCHQGGSRPPGLANILWGNHKHGGTNTGTTSWGGLKAPYDVVIHPTSYNMNCTDCHEPHGSRNEYLLRWAVNGVTNIQIADSTGTYQPNRWYNFCTACHTYTATGAHNPVSQGVPNVQDMDCNQGGGCHSHANAALGFF